MAAQNAEIAAAGEVAITDVRVDGNKNTEAAIGNPLAVPSSRIDLEDLPSKEDDVEYPTEDERHSLRRIPEAIPLTAYWIAFCELAERFSYYGTTQVFQNFIQRPRPDYANGGYTGANTDPEGNAGALNQGLRTAFALTQFNSFFVYLTPVIGAYIADAHWGRYKTICVAVLIATIGHILLIFSSIPTVLDDPNGALGAFIIALIIMGVGTGFFKSNVSTLIAEQVPSKKQTIRQTKRGERVILDPTLTIARLFLYFYLFINIGSVIGQVGMSFASKYVGFWLAYTLPTIVFLFCVPVLYFGRNRYVRTAPTGSVLASAFRLVRYAMRGRLSWNPRKAYRNLVADDFWTNAMPSKIPAEQRPEWMVWDDAWVLEIRRALKACRLFLLYPLYWLTYNQMTGVLLNQAGSMIKNGVPNEIVSNLNPLAIVILIPLLDLFIYPGLRRMGINFSPVKRICAGFFVGALAMVWAAVTQYYIYSRSECGYYASDESCAPAPGMNVWIQSGAYVLISLSELFASVTGLEYAFTKAPKNMRSLVMSIYLLQTAFSNAIGFALTALAADPLLIWNYVTAGGLAVVGGCLFWYWFRDLDKEEDALNNLEDSAYEAKNKPALEASAEGSIDEKGYNK